MKLIVRPMVKEDYRFYKRLFDEAYYEYLETLRLNNPRRYQREIKNNRKVTPARFTYYLNTGSSFVAEKDDEVVGYVATQTIPYMRGSDKVLWTEYIVTKKEHRRRGIATALLEELREYAKQRSINTLCATINPDNEASIKLHRKLGFSVRNWKIASLQTNQ